ncbi:MAG: ABC-type branched-subunit amino acid transport system substrate-binding protein [Nitriliruptoraceae bacterium]|jgi:ABC-type branched-subunit amino acid transport system substrate-binding protein
MQTRSTWRRTAALLAAGAMVLTACAEDTPDDSASPDESAAPSDATTDGMDGGSDMAVATGQGITEEACPEAVNPDNGCIYLGTLSDLTEGPFAALGGPITDAQAAFWNRVNEQGGIGGQYDVDVATYVRDNKYNPETHNALYQEIKPNILALAQTLGSPTTAAIADDLAASNIVAAPASWTSQLEFQDVILESGNNYCVESSNALDYFTEQNGAAPASVLAVHYPGDYGWDGAAGAKKWAAANGVDFANIEQTPVGAGGTTDGAISQIVSTNPDVVILTVAPTETAQIVGGAAAQGFTGRFIGNSPTWNPALLETPALPALQALYWQAAPWAPYTTDTVGHQAMRDALALERGNDGYTAGWVWSYPLLAALNGAYDAGDLTPAGMVAAVAALGTVDYEGMLPEAAGKFGGTPREQAFGQTVIGQVDPESDSGVSLLQDFFEGPTQGAFPFDGPCFVEEGFAG